MDKKAIEERRKKLIEHKDFFKKLMDNLEVGIIVSDEEGYLVYINKAYAKFLNINPEDAVGKFAPEVIASTNLHIVAKTGRKEINYPHELNGQTYLVHRIPIKDNDKIIAVLGVVLFKSSTTLSNILEKFKVLESNIKYYQKEIYSQRAMKYTFESIIGVSEPIKNIKQKASKASENKAPVLITGESGTGKEIIAQSIHFSSNRRFFPFVRVNCAAIPKDLFEAELFGYEKGAFTGADQKGKPGKFEIANKGTIFLDEIGDLPLELQPKLLRVLELQEFERVGGNNLIHSDFRLIAATNSNIEELVSKKLFREDLYYRLNVINIKIPPLRERKEDIIPLFEYFLKNKTSTTNQTNIVISEEVKKYLKEYNWPGNVRELINTVEKVLISLEGNVITIEHLPPNIVKPIKHSLVFNHSNLKEYIDDAERKAIVSVLDSCDWNKQKAAKILGIHRSLLYRKMKILNIEY
jgi:PAS domain S-box-containing protein